MAEISNAGNYALSEAEKTQIATEVIQSLSNDFSAGTLSLSISDKDKADIIAEVLAQLKADSQQVRTLPQVTDLTGLTSLPAVNSDNSIVTVPLTLFAQTHPQEITGQTDIDILVAQGKIDSNQIYFTPVDEE